MQNRGNNYLHIIDVTIDSEKYTHNFSQVTKFFYDEVYNF